MPIVSAVVAMLVIASLGYLVRSVAFSTPLGMDDHWVYFLMLVYSLGIISIIYRAMREGAPLRAAVATPNALFSIFFYVLFVGPYVAAISDFRGLEDNKFLVPSYLEWINPSLLITAYYYFSFAVGAWIGFGGRHESAGVNEGANQRLMDFDGKSCVNLRNATTWLLLLTIVAVFGTDARTLMSGEYTGLGAGSATADGIYYLATHFSMAVVALSFALPNSMFSNSMRFDWRNAIAVTWALTLLVAGDRNNFLLIAAVMFSGLAVVDRKISIPVLCISGAVALGVYNLVEVARSSGARTLSDLLLLAINFDFGNSSTIEDSSFGLTTITMRGATALSATDSSIAGGWYKLVGFLGVIPYSRGLLPVPVDGLYTSAQAVTREILGEDPSWSLGSNIIADMMLDFGIAGGAIGLAAIGYLGSRLATAALSQRSTFGCALSVLIASLWFELPRYSADFPVRSLAWFVVFGLIAFHFRGKDVRNS